MEKIMKGVFWGCAAISIVAVLFIGGFILFNALPFFSHTSLWSFLTGKNWIPSGEIFGIYPMLVASFFATLGAVVIGVVVGISTAIVITSILPPAISSVISKIVDLLAGIPSVIYGFFGLMVIVPIIKLTGAPSGGLSLLAVIIILSFMILPTIIRMTEVSLKAIPKEYKEGAYALGATRLQYIFKVQLRAAKSGIIAGVMLAIGRALGETMAVMLVAGNSPVVPNSILSSVRTVTANIAMEMSYAPAGPHQQALFATGLVLFIIIMAINIGMQLIVKRMERN
ncbi:MAG: phosphate ABC transporter permease subunit PstC [Epulopiscium sp. Nuni2H_MBin003]|nr:MAG: phosphate ABC transporter permease subunit PstC [Epulopiscium sp. Nuni2H_MBin003]